MLLFAHSTCVVLKCSHSSSNQFRVTNLALCIEEHFSDHPGIVKVDDDNFVFYSKMSGASDGLKVVISLLDENGALSSRNLPHVDIETQLVYENGIPVPIMPMKPLKLKCRKKDKGVVRSQKPTFERLNGEPLLGKGKQSTVFKFCLNEVTYHHHGHDGFKVRASIRVGDEQEVVKIHPGVLNEVITVLSKPRKVDTVDKLQEDSGVNLKLKLLTPLKEDMELVGKRKASSQDCDDDYAHHVSKRSKLDIIGENEDLEKTPKVKQATSKALEANSSSHVTKRGEVGESKYPVQRDSAPSLSVPIRTILQAYKCIGKCFACHAEIENGTLCKPEYHSVVCAFADNMLPLFQDVDHSVLQSIDEELFATLFEPIMESKSFEECSKEYIANAPNEVFDTSMFTADGSVMSNDFQDLIREGNKHPANLQYREHIFKTNAACCDVKYALQPPSEKTLNGHARDLSGMSNGNFNSDEIIAGENIFASRFADQDDGTTNNSHPEAGDFLSFLDHVARGEQQCMNNM